MILKTCLLGLLVIGNGIYSAEARPPIQEIELRSEYKFAPTVPLTTEKVWQLDPGQKNPHLQKWIVSRDLKLVGLKAVPALAQGPHDRHPRAVYGVSLTGITSTAMGYARAPGPWFSPIQDFPCDSEPNSWFETQEGAQLAAGTANDEWVALLDQEKIKLALLLERVKGETEVTTLDLARVVYANWVKSVEAEWRSRAPVKVRNVEWKSYLEDPAIAEVCSGDHRKETAPAIGSHSSRTLMDPIVGNPPTVPQILARAPSRLWNGLFSVRLAVEIGGRTLNGRFLIDSSANTSVMSPAWMDSQGIYASWTEIPGAPLERAIWGAGSSKGGQLARRGHIDRITMSGLDIPLHEVLLADTDFFNPPDYVGSCCDGVLGNDFLRLFPMEFQAKAPAEIRVWPKENFHWSEETHAWVQLNELPNGNLVSPCVLTPDETSAKVGNLSLPGVRWDLGGLNALSVHTSWQKKAATNKDDQWNIFCDSIELAHGVHGAMPGGYHNNPWDEEFPATSLGAPLLSRGNFTLDLPHGRIWFAQNGLTKPALGRNKSGLVLKYISKKEGRELRVVRILPRSPAQVLAKAGLKPGMRIVQIDDLAPEEIDLWEVERRLSGGESNQVALQWRDSRGQKLVVMDVVR